MHKRLEQYYIGKMYIQRKKRVKFNHMNRRKKVSEKDGVCIEISHIKPGIH